MDEADPLNFVHSLEHGRLADPVQPDLPEEQQLELRGLYDTMYSGALLFPNADMPYEVAATTWRNLLGCKTYKGATTLDAIRAFGSRALGHGAEAVDFFGPLDGPTPGRAVRATGRGSAVGGEEAARVAAGARAPRRRRGRRRSPTCRQASLAVGEAALELLQRVARLRCRRRG